MQIGRKIYYEKSTGNVILDTSEREGSVVGTTTEQDFASYVALSQRVPETVGVIQRPFGQDREKFGIYAYHVDPVAEAIIWGEPFTPYSPQPANDLQELKDNQLILMDVLATLTEGMLAAGTLSLE